MNFYCSFLSAWFCSRRVITYILNVLKHEMISNLSKRICWADHVASSISCLKSLLYAFETYGHTYSALMHQFLSLTLILIRLYVHFILFLVLWSIDYFASAVNIPCKYQQNAAVYTLLSKYISFIMSNNILLFVLSQQNMRNWCKIIHK